ncbi:hypothetical protein [Jannaschia formosa]|uniref:hypothetical protein n=1 Tax=Jannaschia formosa TaxID=2259592 RepID=UPI000E1BAE12|nr:hypothetical protein [Jannaschia formosa]TFL16815.1 hypothetical protein DR046_18165 [Jannaschia formosa]
MLRQISAAVLLTTAPAWAQPLASPEFHADDVPTEVLSCEVTGSEVSCLTSIEVPIRFCMAVDAEGEPVANSTTVSSTGVATFQGIDPAEIATVRCRPVGS